MNKNKYRLLRMAMSSTDLSVLDKKNSWMIMWWSAALPGMGHLAQGSYFIGLLLMSWEILINLKANLNEAILYTFTGNFNHAMIVLDANWALYYGVVFCFAIVDSYRRSVEINKLALLERQQKRRYFRIMTMSPYGLNYLTVNIPWLAAAWSVLLTGFGQIYNKKAFKAVILLGWTVAIIHFANVNEAIIFTFQGKFNLAKDIVDYEWLLFFPSIYLFSIWDAYSDAVEYNKLFEECQKNYLHREYGRKKKSHASEV